MTTPKRTYARIDNLESVQQGEYTAQPVKTTPEEANLVSSLIDDGSFGGGRNHAPVIDIDLPCRLVPSRTKGHFHLYIDASVPDVVYFDMLDAMARAGVVQRGYARASRDRGASFARKAALDAANATNPADVRIGF